MSASVEWSGLLLVYGTTPGATVAFHLRPQSRAFQSFIASNLKVAFGSKAVERRASSDRFNRVDFRTFPAQVATRLPFDPSTQQSPPFLKARGFSISREDNPIKKGPNLPSQRHNPSFPGLP
jgi:hypothetical protein